MSKYNGMSTSLALIGNALLRNADNEEARKAAAERQAYQLQEQGALKRELQDERSAAALKEAQLRKEAADAETKRKTAEQPWNRGDLGLEGNMAIELGAPLPKVKNTLAYLRGGTLPPEQQAEAEAMAMSQAFRQVYGRVARTGADFKSSQGGTFDANINATVEAMTRAGKSPDEIAQRISAMKGDAQYAGNGMNIRRGGLSQGGRDILASQERQSAAGGRSATSLEDKLAGLIVAGGIKGDQQDVALRHKAAVAAATEKTLTGTVFHKDIYDRAMAEPSASAPAPLLNTGRKPSTSFSAFE